MSTVEGKGYQKGQRLDFEAKQYRDLPWAVLFVLHLIGAAACVGVSISRLLELLGASISIDIDDDVMLVVCALSVLAAVEGAVWLAIIKRYAGEIIHLIFWACIAACLVVGGLNFAQDNSQLGIVFLLFGAIIGLYYYFVRDRIPFTAALLSIASQIIQDYPATVTLSWSLAIPYLVIVVFWSFGWLSAMLIYFIEEDNSYEFIFYYIMFSMMWTFSVLANILHLTVSGVAATWYFVSEPRNPTTSSFKRTMTTSFGSVCLGSLLVVIFSILKSMLKSALNHSVCICLKWVLDFLERLFRMFCMYAFVEVAIYGMDFISGGRAIYDMFKANLFGAFVNDDLSGAVIAVGALIGAALNGFIAWLWQRTSSTGAILTTGVVVYLSEIMIILVLRVVRSAVATVFVGWFEDPNALRTTHPEAYQKIAGAIQQRYGDRAVNDNNAAV